MSGKTIQHPQFWEKFITQTDIASVREKHWPPVSFLQDDTGGDHLALVLNGAKTAESLLRADVAGELPPPGSLSIVEDSSGDPVAVIERTEVTVQKFSDIDDAFARAHGEAGGSLKSWRRQCRSMFAPRCRALKQPFSEDTEIVCIRFHVVYRAEAGARLAKAGQ